MKQPIWHIMQKDDEFSPWFTLVSVNQNEKVNEIILPLIKKRGDKTFPKWKVNGFSY